ncbi:hypothetical protein NIES4071_50840 [Calothrix sp. NIES-4071]|nr:hypothetical protein NIES4071_50840 [Calothrix sp. NIES-4071]BAZ59392.1 hypothetical protein NIES4105_50790 [Calothrix sp. NIES-4105]
MRYIHNAQNLVETRHVASLHVSHENAMRCNYDFKIQIVETRLNRVSPEKIIIQIYPVITNILLRH